MKEDFREEGEGKGDLEEEDDVLIKMENGGWSAERRTGK